MAGKFYFYRMTVDGGGAPCFKGGLWSLAICKPAIRASAGAGDTVIGFAGDGIDKHNGIVHVARVWKQLADGRYYDPQSRFARRPDSIYRRSGEGWKQLRNRHHKPADLPRDIGKDGKKANVLVSRDFRYFGRNRYDVDWSRYPRLRRRLERLKRGHRVNHSDALLGELITLAAEVFKSTRRKVSGKPTHGDKGRRCNVDDQKKDGVCGR